MENELGIPTNLLLVQYQSGYKEWFKSDDPDVIEAELYRVARDRDVAQWYAILEGEVSYG